MRYDTAALNAKLERMISTGSTEKLAEEMRGYIKKRVYEASWLDAVLDVRDITTTDLIPEPGHNDTFFVYGNVELDSPDAVSINFNSQPSERVIGGKRFKIPLGYHATEITTKSKTELLAFDYDVFADVEQKEIMSLHRLRDEKGIAALNHSLYLSGRTKNYTSSSGYIALEKSHLNMGKNILEHGLRDSDPSVDALKAIKHLLSNQVMNDTDLWDNTDVGGQVLNETVSGGYTRDRILGVEYIASLKADLFVQKEAVAYVTISAANASTTVTIDGTAYQDTATNKTAAVMAAAIAVLIEAGSSADVQYSCTVTDAVIRIVKSCDKYGNYQAMTTVGTANAVVGTEGYDLYDVIYTLPDAQFLGQVIRVVGQEIEPEFWKTKGKDEYNRLAKEYFGAGIGNIYGVSAIRLQRKYQAA